MKKERRNPNRLTFRNKSLIRDYLQAKDELNGLLWKMVGGKMIAFYKGSWQSEAEIIDQFPILKQPSLLTNMDNPNKKRNWGI